MVDHIAMTLKVIRLDGGEFCFNVRSACSIHVSMRLTEPPFLTHLHLRAQCNPNAPLCSLMDAYRVAFDVTTKLLFTFDGEPLDTDRTAEEVPRPQLRCCPVVRAILNPTHAIALQVGLEDGDLIDAMEHA